MRLSLLAVLVAIVVVTAVAKEDGTRLRSLAVTVVAKDDPRRIGQSIDDLLAVEMARQSLLQIVDRQRMQAVLKEHAISLGNTCNAKNAIALSKFVGADYLLHVFLEKKTAAVRLVEVAGGQVKFEGQVALRDDLALSAAAIREGEGGLPSVSTQEESLNTSLSRRQE
jgi:hypothetical protein